jgi:hypothetical protein
MTEGFGRPTLTRPADEVALYNAAFLAMLLAAASRAYQRKRGTGLPWILAFLVLPMVLPRTIRAALPRRTSAYLVNWIRSNPLSVLELPSQAKAFSPYVREAMRFGLRHRYLALEDAFLSSSISDRQVDLTANGEAIEIVKAARLLGGWLAKEEAVQVLAQFGVRP